MVDGIRALWAEGCYTSRQIAVKMGIPLLTVENARRAERARLERVAAKDAGPVEMTQPGPPEPIDHTSARDWAERNHVPNDEATINAERARLGLPQWRFTK